MAVLDADLTQQLSSYLTMIKAPIELRAALDDSAASTQLAALLEEIAALSDQVSVTRDDSDPRKPSFAIARVGTDISVRFAGLPLGHEFSSLVLALLHVGGHTIKESEAVVEAARSLTGQFAFETYMSLSCQNCPTVVQALNTLAVLNPNVTHVAIEGGSFQNEVEARNILAVPTIYLNGEVFGQGRMDLAEILAKLDTSGATAARAAETMTAEAPYDVLVVGGGPAGATAAIYTARKGIRTALTATRFGGQVLDTMAIENFISVPYTEGPRLAAGLEEHVHSYDVDVVTGASAVKLIPAGAGDPNLHTVEYDHGGTLRARTVILATGARWRTMGVPGETDYRNKGVTFCPHCDGPLFKGKRVAVIGGGNSGIEAAIDLAGIVGHVTVVEFLDQLKADDVLVAKLRSMPNVDIILSARSTQVLGDGNQVTALEYEDRGTGELHTIDVEGIFVQIGLLPNTEWLTGSVQLSDRKEIVVDAHGATDIPGVFAAGDVSTTPYKQIVIALGSGATAALSAFDHLIRTDTAPADVAPTGAPQPAMV